MSLLSAPGSETTLMKSPAEVLWCTQTMFLSKQVLTANSRWQTLKQLKFLEPIYY